MSDESKIQEMHEQVTEDTPLPPPSFEFLAISLKTQAEVHMGLIQFGEPQKPNARLARHTIDMLAMLQEKTKGNLNMEEQRLIDNSLTELRFRFIQAFSKTS